MGTSQVGFAPFNHPLIGTVTVQLHSVWFIRRKKQDFLGMFPIWATSLLGMSSTNKHSKIWLSLCFQLFVILFNFEHQATCVFLSSFSTLLIFGYSFVLFFTNIFRYSFLSFLGYKYLSHYSNLSTRPLLSFSPRSQPSWSPSTAISSLSSQAPSRFPAPQRWYHICQYLFRI